MHLLLIDRWRGVRTGPTRTPSKYFFGALRDLLVGHERARENHQLEFECDMAFFDALQDQAAGDAKEGVSANVLGTDSAGRPTFEGVPLIVLPPPEN